MDILTPEGIRTEKQGVQQEAQSRVRDLAREEERLVLSVNQLRNEEADEIEKKKVRETESEAQLGTRKTVLAQEVDSLEARKADALKPVDKRIGEIVEREQSVDARQKLLDGKDEEQSRKDSILKQREIAASEHEGRNIARTGELDTRDIQTKARAEEVDRSTQALSAKSLEQSIQEQKGNQLLLEREAELERREKINDIREAGYAAIEEKHRQKDLELVDRAATLASAEREAKGEETTFN